MTFRPRAVSFVLLIWMAVLFMPHAPAVPVMAAQSGVTIAGSVVDVTLKPLAGVVVSLERDARVAAKTTTAADGKFRFTGIAAGAYKVRAELSGFTAFAKDIRIPASATTVQMPIVMTRPDDKKDEQKLVTIDGVTATMPPPPARNEPPPSTSSTIIGGGGAGGGRGGGATTAQKQQGGQGQQGRQSTVGGLPQSTAPYGVGGWLPDSGETYTRIEPNRFMATSEQPLSTFAADVDTASYANVRRFLTSGQLPPREAVRVEELVNYFRFPYAAPRDGRPIAITTEIGACPWAPSHKLVLIGARAAEPPAREITGRNLTLLIDVSGSMAGPERLPLIKTALGMFVDTLRPDDTLSIVTYAGTSGVVLSPTPARHREEIQRAIASLSAGGSTNGGQGLITAYRVARQGFMPGGVNRVILATDGDFNVGIVNEIDLLQLIKRERDSGVFLSVFGVGSGNLKDRTMEMLADKGNGHYAYLDSLQEARRVLIREGEATLNAVAKDVKFQVEFNPAAISAWKLIGYEDRALRAQDFNNDRKDAGEMGAGHTVTALYEVVPAGVEYSNDNRDGGERSDVDPLRYQSSASESASAPLMVTKPVVRDSRYGGEWLTVKTRYKLPEDETSQLITNNVRLGGSSQSLAFAAAVAEFGLLLRDQPRNIARWNALAQRLNTLDGRGPNASDRREFTELVELARGLARIR